MKSLFLIKLGGSLITDKSKEFTEKPDVIYRLGQEIKSTLNQPSTNFIIAHGSGSFGHTVAAKYQTKDGLVNDQSKKGLSLVADAATQINRHVIQNLLKADLKAISFSPLSIFTADQRKVLTQNLDSIKFALKNNFLPVLYGDVIMDKTQGFCIFSSETTLTQLAISLKDQYDEIKIIYAGNTKGVYDENQKTISKLTPQNYQSFKQSITGSNNTDVTGGMLHKVEESLNLTKWGISTLIISGEINGELSRAILGQPTAGTLICQD